MSQPRTQPLAPADLSRALRTKKISSVDLTRAFLDRVGHGRPIRGYRCVGYSEDRTRGQAKT